MHVAVAGGHGQVALLLTRALAARGDRVTALVRDPDHRGDVEAAGGTAAVVDLEETGVTALVDAVGGADALVFAAGAGPGSTVERTLAVDRDGVLLLVAAAQLGGTARFVVLSSMGADGGDLGSEDAFAVYLGAKGAADDAVRASGLDWTVVRPGRLTDDAPTGRVTAAATTGRGAVPRADVAAVLAAVLATPSTVGATFELVAGPTPVTEAVAGVTADEA